MAKRLASAVNKYIVFVSADKDLYNFYQIQATLSTIGMESIEKMLTFK